MQECATLSHLLNNAVRAPFDFVQSDLLEVRDDPQSGRGAYARRNIPKDTLLIEVDHPFTSVIYKLFKKEVCAWCFAYDRGKKWKVTFQAPAASAKEQQIGLAWFCGEECKRAWRAGFCDVGIDALARITILLAKGKHGKTVGSKQTNTNCSKLDLKEIERAWSEAGEQNDNRKHADLLENSDGRGDDEDTLFLMLDGIVKRYQSESTWQERFLSLAPSLQFYQQKPHLLCSHIRMFHFLRAHLPVSLRAICTPETILALVSRDHGNSFGIYEDDGEMLGYGIWVECSMFNHACTPNVKKDQKGRKWLFWAARDVKASEQLCISYLGDDVQENREWRQNKLQHGWDFTCLCDRCTGGVWGKLRHSDTIKT